MKIKMPQSARSAILPLISAVIFGLVGDIEAAIMSYHWQYVGPSGVVVKGSLDANGVDEFGYFDDISYVSMGVVGPQWAVSTGIRAVTDIGGWQFTEPKIRADGSSKGIDFMFITPYNDMDFAFVMHDHTEFGGPFEGEVIYRGTNDHIYMLEDYSPNINWKLWQVRPGTRVPDGGVGLICLAGTFGGLMLLRRLVQ